VSVPDNHIASEQEEAIEQLDPVAELRDDAVAASEAGAAAVEEDLGDGTTGVDEGPGYLEDETVVVEEPEEELDAVEETRRKLAELEGDWYVLHTYAGYENRVKANLEQRISSLNM
jgi:transcriptional antiterminator NusG